MKILRETHEYIKTESGDLEVDLDLDGDGVPTDVTRFRWSGAEEKHVCDSLVPAEVILRIAAIITERRNKCGPYFHGTVCVEHGSFLYSDATGPYKTKCPKCEPASSDEEAEKDAERVIS